MLLFIIIYLLFVVLVFFLVGRFPSTLALQQTPSGSSLRFLYLTRIPPPFHFFLLPPFAPASLVQSVRGHFKPNPSDRTRIECRCPLPALPPAHTLSVFRLVRNSVRVKWGTRGGGGEGGKEDIQTYQPNKVNKNYQWRHNPSPPINDSPPPFPFPSSIHFAGILLCGCFQIYVFFLFCLFNQVNLTSGQKKPSVRRAVGA